MGKVGTETTTKTKIVRRSSLNVDKVEKQHCAAKFNITGKK